MSSPPTPQRHPPPCSARMRRPAFTPVTTSKRHVVEKGSRIGRQWGADAFLDGAHIAASKCPRVAAPEQTTLRGAVLRRDCFDSAKSVFQVHGVDADATVVIRNRGSRARPCSCSRLCHLASLATCRKAPQFGASGDQPAVVVLSWIGLSLGHMKRVPMLIP